MASPPIPTEYARSKLPTLLQRWRGPVGDAVRRFGPRVFPGMPTTALLGLTASSTGLSEVTGRLDTSGSAVGIFGVEGPNVPLIGRSRECIALLGREARTDLTAEGYLGDVDGQVVTGLLNYARHAAAAMRASPAPTYANAAGTSLMLRIAAGAYSAGEGLVAAALTHYRTPVAAATVADRWSALARAIDAETAATIEGHRVSGCYGLAFLIIRAEQRLECGRLLDLEYAGTANQAWFAPWSERSVYTVPLTIRAYGQTQTTGTCQGGGGGGGDGTTPNVSTGTVGGEWSSDDWLFWGAIVAVLLDASRGKY